ncbi:uncharacterized protein G2W53_013966 [Senna tora]|uniref:Uncharacterized protein n=1 Tax=Senna tora TaxID=362788 RepID=A0A834WRI1_9FABA|nr:uncharacterized protein G2W53_013966 [Senna tora]
MADTTGTMAAINPNTPRRSQRNRPPIQTFRDVTNTSIMGISVRETEVREQQLQEDQCLQHPFRMTHALCPTGRNLGQISQPPTITNDELHEELARLKMDLAWFHHPGIPGNPLPSGVPQVQQSAQLPHGALLDTPPVLQVNQTLQVTLPFGVSRVQPPQTIQFGTVPLDISALTVSVPLVASAIPSQQPLLTTVMARPTVPPIEYPQLLPSQGYPFRTELPQPWFIEFP